MIYSDDINKICGLCVNAKKVTGNDTHMCCMAHNNEYVAISREACNDFKYDIMKRRTRRRKKTTDKFKPEDFSL